jgi:hypothetical protein
MEEVGINWWIWHMFVWPCPFIRREWLVQSGPDDRCADRSVIQFSETFSWINELNVKRRILESEHVRQEHFLYVHSCAGITRQKGFIEWVWQGLFFLIGMARKLLIHGPINRNDTFVTASFIYLLLKLLPVLKSCVLWCPGWWFYIIIITVFILSMLNLIGTKENKTAYADLVHD